MLPSFVDKVEGGKTLTYLNSLRRYVRGAVVVPSQANGVIVVPTAGSATNPGVSLPTPLEGPQDANSEFNSLTGVQGLKNYGLGLISTVGTAVTGVGTKFTQQLTVGSTITEPAGQTKIVQSITSDTALVTTVGFAPDVTASNYVVTVPIITNAQNRLTCTIQDMAYQRYLMNNPIPVVHLFGDNLKPSFLCESLFLQKNQALRFQLFNWDTTGPASLGPMMECRKWQLEATDSGKYPEVAARIKGLLTRKTFVSPYWLTFDISTPGQAKVTLPANGSAIGYMTNTGDQTLFLFFAYGHGISSGVAGDTTEKFQITIHDGETNRPYMNQEITLNNGFGTAQNPYWMPHPIILRPRNQLRFAIKNLITDATTDAFITMGGVAILNANGAIVDPVILAEARRIYHATKPPLTAADARMGM